ncbi:hypothetical protein MA16_Dca009931 [Dendrobium catenatum]|uniref:Uncharacterized protein n=1 Tax=Dendrobium catenatum TaxID=906689 RepID=A0A2I0WD80_9ASPA|nr:hypothetical protein MA16_Dca009931 [Dendrobium catenatum]
MGVQENSDQKHVSRNLTTNFENDGEINEVIPKNKEDSVYKDKFVSTWKKMQHIKLNYNTETTQKKPERMKENQVENVNSEKLQDVSENQYESGRMLDNAEPIKEHKIDDICVNNKFQILMEEHEVGEVVEFAKAEGLYRVEDSFETIPISETIQPNSSKKLLDTGDQITNSCKNKLAKEVKSLGPVEVTHRKRKGDSKGGKKDGESSPPGY